MGDSMLNFTRSPSGQSVQTLRLTNRHSGYVAFKVKTTAPKSYLVRPSAGTLKPQDSQDVQITLQPQGSDGQTASHRFLIQAAVAKNAEPLSREQWAELTASGKGEVQEQR